MPNITPALLVQYQAALEQTLTSYVREEHTDIDKCRMTITLQFVMQYNQRLLNTLHHIAFLQGESCATVPLLCLPAEDEHETVQHDTDNMLAFYEKVAAHMVDKLNPHYKNICWCMLLTLLTAASIRCFSITLDQERLDDAAAVAVIWFFALLGFRASFDHSVNEFVSFSEEGTFAYGHSKDKIRIQQIKHWFETSQVFFSKSLADAVKDTMTDNIFMQTHPHLD